MSVSKGAADFALSFSAENRVKIHAGYPRSLYLEVEGMNNGVLEKKLLCVVPRGFDQRDDKQLIKDLSFKLALNQPVAFNLYQAEHERSDVQGALLSMDYKNFSLLAPIETELRTEKKSKAVQNIDVQLQMELSSLGVLKLSCVEAGERTRSWPLEFNVQESSNRSRSLSRGQRVHSTQLAGESFVKATDLLLSFYGKAAKGKNQEKPKASKFLQILKQSFLNQSKNGVFRFYVSFSILY